MNIDDCLKRYQTRYDDGKPTKNICNYGLNVFGIAKVCRNGEYYGVEIMALEEILPLFTTNNITKAYELLIKEEYKKIIELLKISEEYTKHGSDVIHYIIEKWCEVVHILCPKGIKTGTQIKEKRLDERIKLNRSDEIVGKFKIVSIGKNSKTNESVLPEEWLDKEFLSAKDLHNQMNNLGNRKGKPPVTYCCTYGMILNDDVKQWIPIDKILINNYDFVIILSKIKNKFRSVIVNRNKIDSEIKKLQFSKYKMFFILKSIKFIKLAFLIEDNIFKKFVKSSSANNTSYLSSLLQKCFRDHYMSELLGTTIDDLHNSPGYNLPDQHFARVSGVRQLCWRSYISIIEDVCGYISEDSVDLLDLFCLAYVCHIDPTVCLCDDILKYLQMSLKKVHSIVKCWSWRNGKDVFKDTKYEDIIKNMKIDDCGTSRMKNSFLLALTMMPMMRGDFCMLSKCYDYVCDNEDVIVDFIKGDCFTNGECYDNRNDETDKYDIIETKARALDMHCMPLILIQLQGSLCFIPTEKYTLKKLSGFIWDNSSRFNTRTARNYESNYTIKSKKDLYVLKSLLDIQHITTEKMRFECEDDWIINSEYDYYKNKINTNERIDDYTSRLAFILIFGQVHKLDKKVGGKQYDAIICGNTKCPFKIRRSVDKNKIQYIDGKERCLAEKEMVQYFAKEKIMCDFSINPPIGYEWKNNVAQRLTVKIIINNKNNEHNDLEFYVGKTKLKPFDAKELLKKVEQHDALDEIPSYFEELLNTAFYNYAGDEFSTLLQLFDVSRKRRNNNDIRIFNWITLVKKLPQDVLMYVRSKILMSTDELTIGPVDRSGGKTTNSISYTYEGVIWRLIIAISSLYPNVIMCTNNPYKFSIEKNNYGYIHLIKCLNELCDKYDIYNYEGAKAPSIKTKLWNHQSKTIDKIVYGMTVENRKGFGDASDVGSGKTLTALGIFAKLVQHCIDNKSNIPNKGFLVLLPTEKLYDTWDTEITKHTHGFDIIKQEANGVLTGKIKYNSIVITTMGRCRDHPIIHPWIITTIDECLTVQNKEALQTEEAWRQSSYSYFGILMLSATFFRSRFEKMLYMLKMLRTQIPEESKYLDAILSESIVCNLKDKERQWNTYVHETKLDKQKQNKYNELVLKHTEIGFEKVYHMLNKFIIDNVDYIDIFDRAVQKIMKTRPKSKILIYAKSKKEADEIADKIENVCRYKSVNSKQSIKYNHTVLSYAEGTYGLNDLIIYDTILTRPPEPDKLPQMKGRLDRPNQKLDTLYIEYVLIKNTIEDADLYKLEIAKNFYNQHILPLAEYYRIAVIGK